jgi:hypothetical protein
MKHSKLAVVLLAGPALWSCSPGASRQAEAAERSPPTLTGVWHTTRIHVESGLNAGTHTVDVQPAMFILSKTHYAMTSVNGFQARAYLSDEPTEEEQGAAFTPFTGSVGTYASDANTLTLTPQASKDPGDMIDTQPIDYELAWAED